MEKAELFSKRVDLEYPPFKDFPGAISLRKIWNGDKWVWRAKYPYLDESWSDFLLREQMRLLALQGR